MVLKNNNCIQTGRRFWASVLAWCVGLAGMAILTKYLVNSGHLVNNAWGIFGVCVGWWVLGVTCMLVDNYRRKISCGCDVGTRTGNAGFWNSVLDFRGRASRTQFWGGLIAYGFLIWAAMSVIILWLDNGLLALVACLAFLIPLWALFVRRLHDINASGWWTIIPCIGALMCVFSWFVTILWGKTWFFSNVGVDVWGIVIYVLSAVFIGLIPTKKRR